MATPVQVDNLDPAAFAEWVDGQEKPISGADKSQTPQWLIWTNKSQPGHSGLTFGDSKTPGARHLRIGFKNAVALGSVLVRGGGQLSALKTGAAYPGDLSSEADWIPAQRLGNGEVSAAGVARKEIALWIFPPGTQTRALRFTQVAEASDAAYAGFLGGVFVMNERWINLAPLGLAGAGANAQDATRINNGADDTGKPWDNLDNRQPAPETRPLVSAAEPVVGDAELARTGEDWRLERAGRRFGAAEFQSYGGPADRHPRDARERLEDDRKFC